jgi:pimeloyl-ACP methyl ester carboxylesterase
MTIRRLLATALLATALTATGCSGDRPKAAPSPAQPPIAACVSDTEQSTGGVRLPVGNGHHADAVIVGTGATGIVLANQLGSDLCTWKATYGDYLSGQGYRVLMFNYSGEDPGRDALAAVDALRSRGLRKVFLIGASMGGASVLFAAAHARPPVAGVVSLSGPTGLNGVDATAAVRTMTVPALFVAAQTDGDLPLAAQQLYSACASRDKKLDIEPGGAHGWDLVDDRMRPRLDAFLKNH